MIDVCRAAGTRELASESLLLRTEQSLLCAGDCFVGEETVPKHAVVGTVLKVGPGVRGVKISDRIVTIGSHTPVQVCDLSTGAGPNFSYPR
jgi:D-arabinose 1-dehydrogenase-like Zn-dependent alcohol dehydrogenase